MAVDKQAALGAFVAGGLILGGTALVLFGNFHLFSPLRQAAVVFQDSISGLSVGAPVAFRGVRVGAVDRISLSFDRQNNRAYIPVIVSLDPDRVTLTGGSKSDKPIPLTVLVTLGLRAELNTQSFVTGQSEIDLDFDRDSPAILHPRVTDLPEIPTRLSSIARIKQQITQLPLRELADRALKTIEKLQRISASVDTALPAVLASLQTTSDRAQQTLGTANLAVADLKTRVDQTLAHVDRLTATADVELASRSGDLHRLLTSTADTVVRARGSLADIESLTSPGEPARANLDATLRDLAAASASLRGFAADVEHSPQLLLTGRRQ